MPKILRTVLGAQTNPVPRMIRKLETYLDRGGRFPSSLAVDLMQLHTLVMVPELMHSRGYAKLVEGLLGDACRVVNQEGQPRKEKRQQLESLARRMLAILRSVRESFLLSSQIMKDGQPPIPEPKPDKPAAKIARQLLTGWREIAEALEMRYGDRQKIKSLNDRFQGPIRCRGKGTQPIVYKDDLLDWWNKMALEHQELVNRQQGMKLSAEDQYDYFREGTVAPEIGGGVKKRRKDRRA